MSEIGQPSFLRKLVSAIFGGLIGFIFGSLVTLFLHLSYWHFVPFVGDVIAYAALRLHNLTSEQVSYLVIVALFTIVGIVVAWREPISD